MNLLTFLISTGFGFVFFSILKGKNSFKSIEEAEEKTKEIIDSSQKESALIIQKAKDVVQKSKTVIEQFSQRKESYVQKLKTNVEKKQSQIDKKQNRLSELSGLVSKMKNDFNQLNIKISKTDNEIVEKLSQKLSKNKNEVKNDIIIDISSKITQAHKDRLGRFEEHIKENAEKIARRELVDVIQRICAPTSVERRAATVSVKKDIIKQKIFGKNGENINLIEDHFGVDIVFNDAPQTISMSAFSLVSRRGAQLTVEKLTNYRGEINSDVVKEMIDQAEKSLNKELYTIGKRALNRMGIQHNDEEFITTVGKLQYRTSYGQNIMLHSMEVGWVCRMLGTRIGLNPKTCLVAGFLHDVGKAIDQDPNQKDCHDLLSKEIMEKAGFSWEEVHAAWVHHDAIPQETAEAHLVKAADAVSAARPGARQESFEKYLERIKDLEEAAFTFKEVKNAYALSAGRELRVMVDSKRTDDEIIQKMAEQLAEKVENEIVYPGQVRVNIIRRKEFNNALKKHEKKIKK